jgi:hypothetical protein
MLGRYLLAVKAAAATTEEAEWNDDNYGDTSDSAHNTTNDCARVAVVGGRMRSW